MQPDQVKEERGWGRKAVARWSMTILFSLSALAVYSTLDGVTSTKVLTSEAADDFIVVPLDKKWAEANAYCFEKYDSELATIEDGAENADIYKQMQELSIDSLWIGFHKSALGEWQWKDDSQSDYTNWAPQPLCGILRDCARMEARGLWNHRLCAKPTDGFVCAKPPTTTPAIELLDGFRAT